MTRALTSELIRDPAVFAALEPQWWALWRRSPSAAPFQSPAWLLPWWGAFAPGELNVLAVRQADRLVALAPYYIETRQCGPRALPIGISVTDYHDVLIDPACADAAVALANLMTECGSWDEWEFSELPPDAQALGLSIPIGCVEAIETASACPVLVFPQDLDGPQRAHPVRKRKGLRGARNRAARRGAVELMRAEGDTVLDVFNALVQLHHKRWASRGEVGVLADARVRQFHREAVPRLMQAGLLRLYALRIGDDIAAVYYGFFHRDRGYGYLTGFDPTYEFESPGVILLGHAIAEAHREGAREFHFLRGQEPYKYQWGAVDRWNRRRVFHRLNVYARAS
jgi:CelD/BcsL family acetyltransferase involved in cellulose biosynthesis